MKLAVTWPFWRLSSLDLDNVAIHTYMYILCICIGTAVGKCRDFSWRLGTLTVMRGRALDYGASLIMTK